MGNRVRSRSGILLLSVLVAHGTAGVATAAERQTPWIEPLFDGPLVDGPAQRAALHAMAQIEASGDITAAVVTHTVTTRVAGDDEWRAYFGTGWKTAASDRIETADDRLFANWGIDFVIQEYVSWDTSPDTSRDLCGSIYPEISEVTMNGKDVVIGFVKNASTGGAGCALGNKFIVKYQAPSVDWKVTRHEMAHLYGLDHAVGAQHPNDIMEDLYNYPNTFCNEWPWLHYATMDGNSDKYD